MYVAACYDVGGERTLCVKPVGRDSDKRCYGDSLLVALGVKRWVWA